ncbi:Helix-turn-helix domain-containing protein [Chitinophaga sp. CF118]|uniref:helix-turn-helix transcriptional regulator n=1 Tax=Chitinophaga sp. CF118 TaxID=1884367 RepID=UPI0008EB289B|nr:AraC family transcriptional regulator [Chitinophaga sp. CF118]SFE17793.1 Helix-turn-helix domain-containing protein [Chitinophaga sp. CF118]
MPILIRISEKLEAVVTHVIPKRYRKLMLNLPSTEGIYVSGVWGMMIHQQVPIENHLYSEQHVIPLVDMELHFFTTEPTIIMQIILSDEMQFTYPDGGTSQQGRRIGMQYMLPDKPYKVTLHAGQQYHTAYIKLSRQLLEGLHDTFPLLLKLLNTSTSLMLPFERFSATMRTELEKMKTSVLGGQALTHYSNNRISDIVINYLENVHRKGKVSLYDMEVGQLISRVDENPEDTFNVGEQAQLMGLTERSLETAFKHKMGTTIQLYVQKQRIIKAKLLLLASTGSIADIALEVGYSDPSYFNRVFKQATGISPGKYRSDGQS